MEPHKGFICAGNWIVDVIHEIEHWPRESDLTRIRRQSRALGGGPANVATALVRLGTGLPVWPAYSPGSDRFMDLGDDVVSRSGMRKEAFDLLDEVYREKRAARH